MPSEGRSNREANRQAVLVLGMHRSGTSAVAGVISRLGAPLPTTQIAADDRNPKGYSESSAVADFNDRLLASGGSSWRDWQPFDPHWIRSPFAEPFAAEFPSLIANEFGDARLFVVEDPRICRILPFWLHQLERLEIVPEVVLTVRNPLEVAASLEKRDNFSARVSLLLWLRYLLEAEAGTRGLRRAWVHYDDLLRDWRGTIDRLSQTLGVGWSNQASAVDREIDDFLSRELHHHDTSLEQLFLRPGVSVWVKTAYKELGDRDRLYENEVAALEALDEVRLNFDAACDAFRPLVATELRRAIADLERLSNELDFYKKQTLQIRNRSVVGRLKNLRRGLQNVSRRSIQRSLSIIKIFLPASKAKTGRSEKAARGKASSFTGAADQLASYVALGAADKRLRLSQSAEVSSPASTPTAMTMPSTACTDSASIPDRLVFDVQPRAKIAVVCHVYYLSLWDEMAEQIAQIPGAFDLYVTITEQPGGADLCERIEHQHPCAQVRIVANHGRDIFPFVSVLNSGILDSYYLICKLHTKKSPHRKEGDYWRRKLLFGLLGSPENVADIVRGFNANPKLGLVVADGEIYEGERGWKGNRDRSRQLAGNIGVNPDDYPARFVFASMFWARSSALKPLCALQLSAASFEPESGALDGTTAHAIERLFSIFAMAEGFNVVERSRL